MGAVKKLNNISNYNKFVIRDTEHLIDVLKSIMPIKKDIAILNIQKYGYSLEQDYILESLGFKVNENKKIKVSKDIKEMCTLFNFYFKTERNCFIKFRNKETGEQRFLPVDVAQDPYRLQATLKKHFSNWNDFMFSLNLYNNMYKANTESLFNIQSFALDVDFKPQDYSLNGALQVIKDLYTSNDLLRPNIIEYGHRIRLIYLLEEVGIRKGTTRALNLIKKVADTVNTMLPKDLNSKVQPLTSYARNINSINTRNNSKIKMEIVKKERYVLRELEKELLEPLKNKPKQYRKRDTNVLEISNSYSLNLDRLEDFERIQTIREEEYRSTLCYLYRNYCLLAGYSPQESLDKMLEFNSRFSNPLRENLIDGDTKHLNRKQYLHKNETLIKLLDLEPEDEIALNLKTIKSNSTKKRNKSIRNKADYEKNKEVIKEKRNNRYKENLKNNGKLTREEENQIKREKIKDLLGEGLSQRKIALQLDISVSAVNKHITYLKEEGLL